MSRRRCEPLACFLLGAVVLSCGGERTDQAPPSAPIAASNVATREVSAKELVPDVPPLHVVLDEPRFAAAKARAHAKDPAGAARAFDDARGPLVAGGDAQSGALDYVSGRLHRDAGDDAGAQAAFDRVQESCTLAPYAALYSAQAAIRSGHVEDAIARAHRVPDGLPITSEARLTLAEALAAKGDRAAALSLWRAHLSATPHGVRWVDTCVKVATAVLDGIDGDPAAHAQEAFDLATRVYVEAPKLAESSGAQAVRERALDLLRKADPRRDGSLSPSEIVRRAQAWLDANDPSRATSEITPTLGLGAATVPTGANACRGALVRAQAAVKLRSGGADAYGDAIARCAGDDALATALFAGAKASFSAKRTDEGLARLTQLERAFPVHRLADDARLRRAVVLQQNGDSAQAEALFASLPIDYPEGDMRSEALFRLALARMTRGDWAGSVEPLDTASALDEADHRTPSAGRTAYFRARAAAALGETEDAAKRYEALIAHDPLSFYMTQAYARLAAADAPRARRALDAAVQSEPQGTATLLTHDHAELHSGEMARGRALLEVGELDEARREIARALGDAPDPEVAWAAALLYEEAGAPDVAQSLVQTRGADDLFTHYPTGNWRPRWEIAFPRPFGDLVAQASAASNVPPCLTWAVMRQESAFVPDAKSSSDAYGLMQLIVSTARGVARGTGFGSDPDSLKRPDVSIALGAKLLGGLRASYPANRALAIAAYNGGGGSVGRWLAARPNEDFDLWVEEIPFDETRNYLKRVLGNEAAYAFLYAPTSLDEVFALPSKVTR